MLYSIPDYYKEFCCTAGECEDTCCAGWQIVADRKSLRKYRTVRGAYRKKMLQSVDWKRSVFHQDEERRCAFLNEDNLCDMYIHLGEDSLCRTCRLYPRHIEEFEDVREITLSISCPEVAKILMNRMELVHFLTVEREGEESFESYDPFLYSQLLDGRDAMVRVLQNRDLAVNVRTKLVLGMAHDMQIRVNSQELFSCGDVLAKYEKAAAVKFVRADLTGMKAEEYYGFVQRMFHVLDCMELLKEDWYVLREETKQLLYAGAKWREISEAFAEWTGAHAIPWEIQKEQLLVYFITTYFCGAVYDGRLYDKVQMAVGSVVILEELLKARWLRNEEMVDTEDVTELVYRYSREIEHSDENLKRMEKLMHTHWKQ